MKKRFTVMLEETTIKRIKNLGYSPCALRETIEWYLEDMIAKEQTGWQIGRRIKIDDK